MLTPHNGQLLTASLGYFSFLRDRAGEAFGRGFLVFPGDLSPNASPLRGGTINCCDRDDRPSKIEMVVVGFCHG
jgi:hypothetical protein